MKLDSFKFKISLLSLLLSGAVLLAFGLFFMSVISRVGYQRIDRELRLLADVQVRRQAPPGHWMHFEESLRSVYGEREGKQFAIKVVSVYGRDLYTSSHWPTNLSVRRLPVLDISPPGRGDEFPELEGAPRRMWGDDGQAGRGIGGRMGQRPFLSGGSRPMDNEQGRRGPPPLRMIIRGPVFATLNQAGGNWRVIGVGNAEFNLYLGMNLSAFDAETIRFRNAFLIALPSALFLLAFGGWLIAHRALRPVKVIAETAGSITTRDLKRRIPRGDADREFAGLIDVINGMLDRLEKSFQQAVRFSGDAAHELKTPLTILQGQLEQALQEAPSGSAMQQKYGSLLEEVRRLSTITKKLLLLSQADSGGMRLSLAPFDLSAALEAMAEDIALLAPDVKLEKEIPPGIQVMADADMMKQVLQNLVTNAVKYNCKGGWIRFVLAAEGASVNLAISNSGEEIQPAEREKVFERFYRVSKSRNREVEGVGLGLSLAREIVLAHKGELVLEGSSGGVTTFVMTLPVM